MVFKNKALLVANTPSHYREEIYKKLSNIGVDFYFSDMNTSIKSIELSNSTMNHSVGRYIELGFAHFVVGAVGKAKEYKNIIAEGNIRSLHVWLILLIALLDSNKKVFLWSHGWYGREGFLKRVIKKLFFRLANCTLTYNERAREMMIEEGISQDKIIPIYNSLRYEEHLNLRTLVSTESDAILPLKLPEKYFVFVGRIQTSKNLELVLDAMKLTKASDYKFIAVGPIVDEGSLANYAKQLNLKDRVELIGPIYDEIRLASILSNAVACISPGHIGLTAIHSLSFGTPAISHNDYTKQTPEVECIIPETTGWLFDFGSSESLASVMEKALNCTQDERALMSKLCFEEIDKKWNTRAQVTLFESLLNT